MKMTEPISPQSLAQRYRGKPVRRMHVMVKPTGALCNLDCTYCYYLSKQELLGTPEQWRISDEVLDGSWLRTRSIAIQLVTAPPDSSRTPMAQVLQLDLP